MRRFLGDRWILLFLGLFLGMLLYLQYLVFQSTEKLKQEEIEKTRIFASHIAEVLVKQTGERFYDTLRNDPTKRDRMQRLLEAFLIPKYEYIFVVKREKSRRYRFLLDGSRDDKEEFGTLFVPVNSVYDRIYERQQPHIVKQQDDIKGVWLSLLYPIVIGGKTEAMLILDLSDWYGKYLEEFNLPVKQVITYVQAALLIMMAVLFVVSWRYEVLRKKLFVDKVSKAHTKAYMHDVFARQALDRYHALLIDIDGFASINKFYGYETGDEVLRLFVKMLRMHLPKGSQVIRVAGAEFFVFIPSEHTLRTTVASLFEAIRQESFVVNDYEIKLHVSIAAMSVPPATSSIQYIQHALYEELLHIKNSGKNAYSLLDMQNLDELKYRQIDYIHRLIEQQKIKILYQPICDAQTKETVKYEALVRLVDDEEGKLIVPNRFMNTIRGTSLYIKMSKLIFQHIFERLKVQKDVHLSVNLDLDDLYNPDMMALIMQFMQDYPAEAKRLTFEILEKSNIRDYAKVNAIFDRLQLFGSKIAIDDFGTGYANFQHLLYLNVNIIKIDGSLIRELENDNRRFEDMLRAILMLTRRFGYESVAEFVSSEKVYKKVKALGFDYVQGYYLGKPEVYDINEQKTHSEQ